MFYEVFERLCHERGTSPFACCKAIGLNGGTAAYWKRSGGIPKRETLEKLSEFLGCSVDYLLDRDIKNTASADRQSGEEIEMRKRTGSEWEKIILDLSPENRYMLLQFAEFLLWKQAQDGQAPK